MIIDIGPKFYFCHYPSPAYGLEIKVTDLDTFASPNHPPKVLCILHHRGVHLILVYSWARSAIFAAGMGRGGMFLFLLFLYFHSFSSFSPVPLFQLSYLFYLSSPFLWEITQNDPQGLTCR